MNLASRLKEYTLRKLLQRIAENDLLDSEIKELEAYGIDEHARHYIMLTNGSLKAFMQMYGTMEDELKEIDKIAESLTHISQ